MRPLFPSLAAACYLLAFRIFHQLHSAIQSLFEGFWMGLLPDSAVDIISQKSYEDGGNYILDQRLDSGLQFWEEIAVQRFFPPGCRVLVGAAGGGREVIALARAGFAAEGFECCRPMVEAGKRALLKRGIESRLEWAPPCRMPANQQVWDAAIIGWNGYTYMSPRQRRLAFLGDLREHLQPGAPVLLSGALRSRNTGQLFWTPRIANAVRILTFRTAVFTTGTRFPGRPRHEFTRSELEAEVTAAGFTPAGFWRWGPFGALVCINSSKPC